MMKRIKILGFALAISAVSSMSMNITLEGSTMEVISEDPSKSTGLDKVYVVYDASQLTRMVINGVNGNVNVSEYSNLGGGYSQEVSVSYDEMRAIVSSPKGDRGYIISDGDTTMYIWIVDYKPKELILNSASGAATQNCDNTVLDVSGNGAAIYYYTIDGRPVELSREIKVKYHTLQWSSESEMYMDKEEIMTLSHLSSEIAVTPPIYCNSVFNITGDRFLEHWGIGRSIETPIVYANGIAAETDAEQSNMDSESDSEDASNVIKTGDETSLGGSAPADIDFRAWVTDAVMHSEWQMAQDADFENITHRWNEQELSYTFNEEGVYYVRFVGSNSDGSCETIGDTYTVSIGSSELRIPNAFSPNEDGVNDVWKVGYRSLLKFHCSIFDRYGSEIFSFDDPRQGWDGKYKGKYVKPGVYFYVIEAQGADGKKYRKGGDINIIKSKRYGNSGSISE